MARIIFGMSGASGMPLALSMLSLYRQISGLEIHLVISTAAETTLAAESGIGRGELEKFAHVAYDCGHLGAPPASGSWICAGMVVCPCSMSSLGAIANGCGTNLLHRAADVTLKERRPLVLVARETPLNLVHLRNMVAATEAGATIMPYAPAFYSGASTFAESFRQFAGRVLDQLKIPHDLCRRWGE